MDTESARTSALIALSVFVLSEIVQASINYLTRDESYFHRVTVTSVATIIMWYALPFLVAYKVEKRDARSLALTVSQEKYIPYATYAIIGSILPGFFVGFDAELIIDFVEQVVYIGLAEEFFHRGYSMNRFRRWLGDWRGLLLSASLFSLGHIVSRLAERGLGYAGPAAQAAAQAFLGGLIFGYIYLRSESIWPSAIAHVSSNMYINKILELFSV